MPLPVSLTCISAILSMYLSVISTRPLGGVNLIALDSKFQTTCCMRTESPVVCLYLTMKFGTMTPSPKTKISHHHGRACTRFHVQARVIQWYFLCNGEFHVELNLL